MGPQSTVVIGGGTGSYTTLTGLKHYSDNLTAVVTMSDDGGSSGILRDEFGHLPPGDVRRCLVALSADDEMGRTLRHLFEYRFDKGLGLNGHNFGNLLITALMEITGSMELAILEASRLLNIKGRVLPVTTDDVRLCATLEDGTVIRGEKNIDVRTVKPHLGIRQVFLSPSATGYEPALDAIRNADFLVIGPGDLYTSIIPNLLVQGVPDAIRDCKGKRIYICNLMTKHGETDGFAASRFLEEIYKYIGSTKTIDRLIVNNNHPPIGLLRDYATEKSYPVIFDEERCQAIVTEIAQGDLRSQGDLLRHNPRKLAQLVYDISENEIDSASETSGDVACPSGSRS